MPELTLAQQINAIIADRREDMRPAFNKCLEEAQPIMRFCAMLSHATEKQEWVTLLKKYPDFKKVVTPILEEFKKFKKEVEQKVGVAHLTEDSTDYKLAGFLQTVDSRIQKDSIEILICGPFSSGKSVLIRALTGLPDHIVPSGDGKTTATTCTFHNSPRKKV